MANICFCFKGPRNVPAQFFEVLKCLSGAFRRTFTPGRNDDNDDDDDIVVVVVVVVVVMIYLSWQSLIVAVGH